MNKGKGFFKTCFNTVAGLEVKNESQAIAKEVVLSEIKNLEQENKQLREEIEEYKNPIKYFKYANKNVTEENKQLKAALEMYENGVYFSSENDKLKEENKQLKEQLYYNLIVIMKILFRKEK